MHAHFSIDDVVGTYLPTYLPFNNGAPTHIFWTEIIIY